MKENSLIIEKITSTEYLPSKEKTAAIAYKRVNNIEDKGLILAQLHELNEKNPMRSGIPHYSYQIPDDTVLSKQSE